MKGSVLGGRYLADEEIGSGGMGAVYRGTDLRTGGHVAIKVPHPWLDKDSTFLLRLRREAEIAASLTNPRIVRVIDFDMHEGRPFLVMEYIPGPTLADVLTAEGTLEWREAARIGIEVARALDAAHQRGIVHRDLKPQNIKVVDGDVKVLDFGIARAEGSQQLTSASVFVGTPDYVAPERMGAPVDPNAIPGDPTVPPGDIRSDIYSLGIIIYEMLTGKPPFGGTTSPWALLKAHESEPPPPLSDEVPFAMQAVVARCLAKRPDARFQTPRELVAALQDALADPESRRSTGQNPLAAGRLSATGSAARPTAPTTGTATATPPGGTGTQPRPSTPEWGTAVPRRSGRPAALYALGGAAAVIVLAAILIFALQGTGGGDDEAGTPPGTVAAQPTAAATQPPASSGGLRVERLVVFPRNAANTEGDGGEPGASEREVKVCYDIPNASQALLKVIIASAAGAEAGRAEFNATPSGRECRDIATEPLQAGTYVVRLLDATNQELRQRRFNVR